MNNSENTLVNPLPSAMRDGFVLGLLFSGNFLLSAFSNSFMQALTYFLLAMIVIYTWRSASRFRDQENGGTINFYRVFSYIFLLFFFASLISAVVKLVYLKYINTEYLNEQISAAEQLLKQLGQEKILAEEDIWQSVLTPINFTMQTIMVDTMLGAVLGLLFAPFIKKQ